MAKLENIELVNQMINEHYLNVQRHPNADIYLYNYSKVGAIYHVWNDVTMMCRGLICDGDFNILSRPFPKFFNYEEIEDKSIIPNLPFEAYEKLDGSLGIMYWIGDTPYITTRGSFVSEQGQHASKILQEKYAGSLHLLDRNKTYLFEILYPEDHHVVEYGRLDDIFLLAVIDTETGEEDDIYNWQHIFKCVKKYDGCNDFTKIRDMFSGDNREGFVIKFANNFRIKLKYEEYFRLSFMKNNFSKNTVLEYMMNDDIDSLKEALEMQDEENKIYFTQVKEEFQNRYNEIEQECKDYYKDFETDKEAAEYFLKFKYQGILFMMRKNIPYNQLIWKQILKEYKQSLHENEES